MAERIKFYKITCCMSLTTLLLLLPILCFAQDCRSTASSGAPGCQSRLVSAEGFAPVLNGDVGQARNMALYDARVNAVAGLGEKVGRETVYSMGLQVADWLSIKAVGYIRDWEPVESECGVVVKDYGGKKKEGYRAKICAWIKCDKELNRVKRDLLSLKRILVVATGEGSAAIERELTRELNKIRYKYLDSKYIKNNSTPQTWYDLTNRRILSLSDDAFKFMSDLVIHIDSSVELYNEDKENNVNWFRGLAAVSLFQISGENQGEPIVDIAVESEQMFRVRRYDAPRQIHDLVTTRHTNGFQRKIARPAVAQFMERLLETDAFRIQDREIVVSIDRVPSRGEYKKFLTILRHQRGVDGQVREIRQAQDRYTVGVNYPLKSIYLANLMAVNPKYRLVTQEWNKIEFEFRGL